MKKIIFIICILTTILLAGCKSNNQPEDIFKPDLEETNFSGEVKPSGEEVSKDIKNAEYLNLYQTKLSDLLTNKNIDIHDVAYSDIIHDNSGKFKVLEESNLIGVEPQLVAVDSYIPLGKFKLDDKEYTLYVAFHQQEESDKFDAKYLFAVDENNVISRFEDSLLWLDGCEFSTYNDSYLLVVYETEIEDFCVFSLYDKNMKEVYSHVISGKGQNYFYPDGIIKRFNSYVYSLENNKILFSAPEWLEDEERAKLNLGDRIENYYIKDYELLVENGEFKLNLLKKNYDKLEFHSYVR